MNRSKQLKDKICPICGITFNRKRYGKTLEDATRYSLRLTCSQSCGNTLKNPRDRTTYYLRARIYKAPSCEMCGSEKKLDAHHKNGNIKNNSMENIQTLCHTCHMKLHWQQWRQNGGNKRIKNTASKPLETP